MKRTKSADIFRNPWLALIILAFIAFIIYSNIYDAPFVFDDNIQIEEKVQIRNVNRFFSVDKLFASRPLVDFTFALNYEFGQLHVLGYHLVNVLIHMTNAFLVYFLVLNIGYCLNIHEKSFSLRESDVPLMALLSALIFVTHPIQTQAVTYTVQRYASMAALFYFSSVLCYIKAREAFQGLTLPKKKPKSAANLKRHVNERKKSEQKGKQKEPQHLRFKGAVWFSLTFFCGILAFLCKQNAATLPGIILLIEYLLFDTTWRGWKKKLVYFIPAFLLMAFFILYVSGFFKGGFDFGRLLEDVSIHSRETATITRWQYLCTQFKVVAIYVRLLFLPFGQNLDPMYPFARGFLDGWTPLAFLFLVGILAIGLWFIRKKPIISLGIFWFFITLSVESSIIPISDAMFEHRLYLPMFGFAIAISYALFDLFQGKRIWIGLISAVLIGYFGITTYLRNEIYKNPVVLWSDVLKRSPENPRAYNNLGFALYHQGKLGEAINSYYEGLRIKPDFGLAKNNLGTALLQAGRLNEAIKYLSDAIRLMPRYAGAYNNLAVAFARQGNFKKAVTYFQRALKMQPSWAAPHNGLANAFASQGQFDKAVKHWSKAIELRPDYAAAHYNLGIVLEKHGKVREAEKHFLNAIKAKPGYAEAHSKLALVLEKRGDLGGAMNHFTTALRIKPGLIEARQGLKRIMESQRRSRS